MSTLNEICSNCYKNKKLNKCTCLKIGDRVEILVDKHIGLGGTNAIEVSAQHVVGTIFDVYTHYNFDTKPYGEKYNEYTIRLRIPFGNGIKLKCFIQCMRNEIRLHDEGNDGMTFC